MPQVNHDHFCLLVYPTHQKYLLAALLKVRLINAYRIGPNYLDTLLTKLN